MSKSPLVITHFYLPTLLAAAFHTRIVTHAELISDIAALYRAGADYVSVPRLIEAERLSDVICAACEDRLAERRAELDERIAERNEVIP